MKAIGALSMNVDTARAPACLWSADKRIERSGDRQQWPAPGQSTFACPQGGYRFVCRRAVKQLENPMLRSVEVRVFPAAGSAELLADAATVIHNAARF